MNVQTFIMIDRDRINASVVNVPYASTLKKRIYQLQLDTKKLECTFAGAKCHLLYERTETLCVINYE